MAMPRPQSLPVMLLIRTAFQLLKQQRDDALRLGFVPAMICFGGCLYGQRDLQMVVALMSAATPDQIPDGAIGNVLVMTAILLLSYCLIVVNWLRFVLLGPMAAVGLGLHIGRHHAAYLAAVIALGLVTGIVMSVASMPFTLLSGFPAQLASVTIFILIAVGTARFVPFLVALAVNQPMTLQQAWQSSRGNGITVLTALVLAYAPFLIAVFLLATVLQATGFATAAPIATLFIATLLQVAAWIVHAGVLATAYRHIVGIRV